MDGENLDEVSISDADCRNGSPKIGDMIARNPKNHKDQWLVAKAWFLEHFVHDEDIRSTGVILGSTPIPVATQ